MAPQFQPTLRGRPIAVHFQPRLTAWHGKLLSHSERGCPVHAASFLRKRRIVLEEELQCNSRELGRILAHELCHFAWLRLGNPRRRSWEELIASEWRAGVEGELGWSAEQRKGRLRRADANTRSLRWRQYACESFCDTGAWLFSALRRHSELTLPADARRRRRQWFATAGLRENLPV